jgi:hypothetical protein
MPADTIANYKDTDDVLGMKRSISATAIHEIESEMEHEQICKKIAHQLKDSRSLLLPLKDSNDTITSYDSFFDVKLNDHDINDCSLGCLTDFLTSKSISNDVTDNINFWETIYIMEQEK